MPVHCKECLNRNERPYESVFVKAATINLRAMKIELRNPTSSFKDYKAH